MDPIDIVKRYSTTVVASPITPEAATPPARALLARLASSAVLTSSQMTGSLRVTMTVEADSATAAVRQSGARLLVALGSGWHIDEAAAVPCPERVVPAEPARVDQVLDVTEVVHPQPQRSTRMHRHERRRRTQDR